MNLSFERNEKYNNYIQVINNSIIPENFHGTDLYTCLVAAKDLCQSISDNSIYIPQIAFSNSYNALSDLYNSWQNGINGNVNEGNLALDIDKSIIEVQKHIGWYLRPPETTIIKKNLTTQQNQFDGIIDSANDKIKLLDNEINRITKRLVAVNFSDITKRSFVGGIIAAVLMSIIIVILTWFAISNYADSQQQYDSILAITERVATIRANNPSIQVNQIFPPIPDWVVWKLITARVLLITLGSVVLVMLFKLFRAFQHNHTVNSHRASALSIGEDLIKALKGTQAEIIAAAQAYEAIFAHQDSGFSDGKKDQDENFASIVRSALDKK